MAQPELTPQLALLEEAITVLFCRIDDAYYHLNPEGGHYASLKELSDSEVITLALFQQLRGIESRALLLARGRPLLLPSVPWSRRPSSLLVPSAGAQAQALPRALAARHLARVGGRSGDHDRRLDLACGLSSSPGSPVGGSGDSSAGAAWVRWGSFSVYGVKLHMLCATNRVPISYELTPANTADVSLTEELLAEAIWGRR